MATSRRGGGVDLAKNTQANAKKADAWFAAAPVEEALPVVREAVARGSVAVQRVAIPHLFRLLPGPEAASVLRTAIERHHGHASYGGCGWGFERDGRLAEAIVASQSTDAARLLAEVDLPWPLGELSLPQRRAFLERLAELPADVARTEHLLGVSVPVTALHEAAPEALRLLLSRAVELAADLTPTPLHVLATWLAALDERALLEKLPVLPLEVRLQLLSTADGATRARELEALFRAGKDLNTVVDALTPADASLAPMLRQALAGDVQKLALLRVNDAETRQQLEALAAGLPDQFETQRAVALLEQAGLRTFEVF